MKDVILLNLGNFTYLGAQWIISVALVRLGGFEDAGLFSLAMSVANVFVVFGNYGLRTYQVSDINNRFTNGTYIINRIITVIISFVFCVCYGLAVGYSALKISIICAYMLYKCIEAISDVLSAIWQKDGDITSVSITAGVKGLLNMFAFFAAYLISRNLLTACIFMALSSVLVLITYDFGKTKKHIRLHEIKATADLKQNTELLKTGFITMLISAAVILTNSIPKLVIEKMLDSEKLGIFSSIATPTVIISTFAVGVLLPLVKRMADLYENYNGKALSKIILVCNAVIIGTGILAAIVSVFAGKPVFSLVYGSEILPYFTLFYYMIAATVFIALLSTYSTVLTVARKLKQQLAFSASACLAVLILSLVLVKRFDIYGAAYAMLISLSAQFVFESIYIYSVIHKLKN